MCHAFCLLNLQNNKFARKRAILVEHRHAISTDRSAADIRLESLLRHLEQVGLELGELAGAVHRFGVDQVGRQDFGVAMLAGVQVEHEVHQGAFELGAEIPVESEAGAGDFGGAFQVEDAELLAELPVRLGGEVELGLACPSA